MASIDRKLLALAALALCWGLAACAARPMRTAEPPRILLFSGSTGYRHESIEPGIAAIQALAAREGFAVTVSADPAVFDTAAGLRPYRAIVLLSTTTKPDEPASEWFVGPRREALQAYMRAGGGVVGIHAAADSHYHWPWYRRMIGGQFRRHPPGTPAGRLRVERRDHPSTRGLPAAFTRTDEWYFFNAYDPASQLLVTLDPASIKDAEAGPAPISWARTFEGGRVFYTAMGHTTGSFSEPVFLQHLAGGLRWATGLDAAPAR